MAPLFFNFSPRCGWEIRLTSPSLYTRLKRTLHTPNTRLLAPPNTIWMVCTKHNINFLALPTIEPLTSDVQLISFTSLLFHIQEGGAVQRDYFRYVPGIRSANLTWRQENQKFTGGHICLDQWHFLHIVTIITWKVGEWQSRVALF